jgi:peptidoglycan L-alanyl-D-glutamate endopeptidase CwlK
VAAEAIKHYDFTVICGHRTKAEQTAAVLSGASKLAWPKSKHNSNPSLAMDCVPYPLDWNDDAAFTAMATEIKAAAQRLDIGLDWGFDLWGFDMPHFQLRSKK